MMVSFDLEKENNGNGKTEWTFTEFLKSFFEEIYGVSCLRPLPPLIGEGQTVDLLKLRITVRKRGGYRRVSENGLWRSVAADCGFNIRVSAALKLIYVKYFDSLDRLLRKIEQRKGSGIEERYLGFRKILMELESSKVEKDDDNLQMIDSKKRKRQGYMGILNWIHRVAKDPRGTAVEPLPERQKWKNYGSELQWKQILAFREAMLLKKNVVGGSQQLDWQKKQKMHPSMYDDDQCSSERLRFSQRLISSKDSSPKPQDWNGNDSSSSGLQSEDDTSNKMSNSKGDLPTYISNYRRKKIPISPHYQADTPEFDGGSYESKPKWLGTKIWPLDKSEQRKKTLIERDPIGKGRQESCGCQFVGSLECVKFHIRGKKMKVKLELGSAFYLLKLEKMGDDVALSWTKEDQEKFRKVVKANPLSSGKYLWKELLESFPNKGREALVSYYFNVFLLQRRGIQNRSSPININSDDEESESESVPVGNRFGAGSILCSPKRVASSSER